MSARPSAKVGEMQINSRANNRTPANHRQESRGRSQQTRNFSSESMKRAFMTLLLIALRGSHSSCRLIDSGPATVWEAGHRLHPGGQHRAISARMAGQYDAARAIFSYCVAPC